MKRDLSIMNLLGKRKPCRNFTLPVCNRGLVRMKNDDLYLLPYLKTTLVSIFEMYR